MKKTASRSARRPAPANCHGTSRCPARVAVPSEHCPNSHADEGSANDRGRRFGVRPDFLPRADGQAGGTGFGEGSKALEPAGGGSGCGGFRGIAAAAAPLGQGTDCPDPDPAAAGGGARGKAIAAGSSEPPEARGLKTRATSVTGDRARPSAGSPRGRSAPAGPPARVRAGGSASTATIPRRTPRGVPTCGRPRLR